jgi:glucose-1-phosphate cytidylyltransferase
MVEIGGRPILWHIMRHYSRYGHHEFVLCLGYRGDVIREYFLDYLAMNGDVRVCLRDGSVEHLDTLEGERTGTAGRLLRARRHLDAGAFMWTYGDGVANVDLAKLASFHRAKGRLATATGARPPSRFGELEVRDGVATSFLEKPQLHTGRVNAGFFVMEPSALDVIEDEGEMFERGPMERLTAKGQLAVFEHAGYWAPMDTYRDMVQLNEEWDSGSPGWLAPL